MNEDERGAGVPHERLTTLVQSAIALPQEEQERWVDQTSAGDSELKAQLIELLRQAREETRHLRPPSGSHPGRAPGSGSGTGGSASGDDLPLMPGQHVGRYEILDLLGSGGMGSVYRALDSSLGREVAIKALGPAFRGDSVSLRRFEREARVLATLSHPNIATIYGFERLEGSPYLVLERVEGETLAQRLARGPLALHEASAIAVQVAEGLEEAHAKGVIHRDLKPSNVMLASGGRAKLVDFGLAKTAATRADREDSAEPITHAGAILGTARYMSPEQVKGEEVDTRTDVWAFGCLLYEMLTGRPAFAGRSVAEVLAAVLRDEPDWSGLPATLPPGVIRVIRRCLRRDAKVRLQHIGDARVELTDAEAEPAGADAIPLAPRRSWMPLALLATAAIAALLAVWVVRAPFGEAPARPVRLSLDLPSPLTWARDYPPPFAITPDGSVIAIGALDGDTRRLYVRALDDPAVRALPGTDDGWQPFFAPDGTWIGFFADRKLGKVPVGGGPVLWLADIGHNPRGAAWAPDGTIIVAPTQTSGLVRVPERGGRPVPLTTVDAARGEYSHRWPEVLPGGKWVLFTVGLEDASFDEGRIEAASLETGERRLVLAGAGFARYVPGRGLLFVRGGRLHAVGFDLERAAVNGTPEVVLDAVRYDHRNGGCHLAVSASGLVIYTPGKPTSADYYLTWIDSQGRLTRAVDTPRPFRDVQASPEGKRIAAVVGPSTDSDVWVVDANATLSRLSFGLAPHRPTWTADGTGITVGSERDRRWRLMTLAVDGGEPRVLFEGPHRLYPNSWSPDGRFLVFQERRPETGWDLQVLEVDASGRPTAAPKPLAASPFHESTAAISADGRWVAYESDEIDGVVQVYIRSFPDGANKLRASSEGARWPDWDRAGSLYFLRTGEGGLRRIRTRQERGQLMLSPPEPVWRSEHAKAISRIAITVAGGRYGIDRPAARFVALETPSAESTPPFSSPVVLFNWASPPTR